MLLKDDCADQRFKVIFKSGFKRFQLSFTAFLEFHGHMKGVIWSFSKRFFNFKAEDFTSRSIHVISSTGFHHENYGFGCQYLHNATVMQVVFGQQLCFQILWSLNRNYFDKTTVRYHCFLNILFRFTSKSTRSWRFVT